jgi:DNA-binding MarR family transcriptional regulator
MSKSPKSRPRDRSPLYRLIAAGQLAHRAVLAPALARGLAPGEDALLYLLAAGPMTETALVQETGLSLERLREHIARLAAREHVVRKALGADMQPHLTLTPQGARLAALLGDHWDEVERALLAELKPRQRKILDRRLSRLLALLSS